MKTLPETAFVNFAIILGVNVANCLGLAYKGSVTELESVLYNETV